MGVPHVQGTWRWGNKAFVSVNVSEFSAPSRLSACPLSVTCTKLILFDPNIFDIHLLCRKSLAPLLTTNTSGLLQDEPQYSVYLSDLYTKPWCRIGAYLVGMITGYVIHNYNNKIRMPKVRGAFPRRISLSWVVETLHGRQVALATPKVHSRVGSNCFPS